VLEQAVADHGYALALDFRAGWAFCPYYAGVDIIFQSSAERDDFADRHQALLPTPTDEH
jgi:hypothetical protein